MAGAEPSLRSSLRTFAVQVDTEAVLQEALLRLWQVAPRVQPDGRPNSLLRVGLRIASNLALAEARKRRPQLFDDQALALAADAAAVAPVLPDPLLRQAIARCREKLPKKPADALAQRLLGQGDPDPALAAALGMTLNTFLQNFTRARKLLAKCLGAAGIDLKEVLR